MKKTFTKFGKLKFLARMSVRWTWKYLRFILRHYCKFALIPWKFVRRLFPKKKLAKAIAALPPFHPQTIVRDWGNGEALTIEDLRCGCVCLGQIGGGKTSGVGKHVMYGMLAAGFGALVCCVKTEEREQIVKWATECGRASDLIIVDTTAKFRFNFLKWESEQGAPGGVVLNTVAILEEIAKAVAKASGQSTQGGGDSKFWEDSLHLLLIQLVSLPVFLGLDVSLTLLRDLLNSAPTSYEQMTDEVWRENSVLWMALSQADELTLKASPQIRTDFEQCRNFWLVDFTLLAPKTRSIITMTFGTLVQPIIMGFLNQIFCRDTNVRPEETFDGRIIVVDCPIQELRLVGKIANLIFKYCTQIAILRRKQPTQPGTYLRPVVIYADECHYVLSDHDQMFQTTARSVAGCSFYLTQNRDNLLVALGNNAAVDSLLSNLTNKFFCKNTGSTNEYAANIIGKRYVDITSTSVSHSGHNSGHNNSGTSNSEQYRFFVEPQRFTTLKHGGAGANNFVVETIVFKSGSVFRNPMPDGEEFIPFKLLALSQI